jgi:hypothetical protein
MTKIEEMQSTASLLADQAEAQSAILRKLNLELERTGETLDPRTYSDLRARIELQEMHTATASRKAREKQAELDALRSAEADRLHAEMAQRAYDDKLSALNATRAEIASKRSELARIQNELPLIEQRQNILLFELSRAKTALQQSA